MADQLSLFEVNPGLPEGFRQRPDLLDESEEGAPRQDSLTRARGTSAKLCRSYNPRHSACAAHDAAVRGEQLIGSPAASTAHARIRAMSSVPTRIRMSGAEASPSHTR